MGHFVSHTFKIDAKKIHEVVEQSITAPATFHALLQAAFLTGSWLDYDDLRKEVLDSAKKHPLMALFSSFHTNAEGAVIAREEPFDPDNGRSVEHRMIHDAREFKLGFNGKIVVPFVTDILHSRYQVPFVLLKELVDTSPIMPPGHSETIARGLHAGITGDWLATAVYLIPAVEPLVREQLRSHGAHTAVFREDIEQERSLSELLAMPELVEIFGRGLILELRVLLTEQIGFNLRHQYCHGLLRDDQLGNPGVLALWMTMLRLALFPWRHHIMGTSHADADTSEAEGSAQADNDSVRDWHDDQP